MIKSNEFRNNFSILGGKHMEFSAVYHRTSDNMCYCLNEDELIINLKTGYDVEKVFLHYGDPFEAGILGGNEVWKGERIEIPFKKRLKHQIWWTTTVRPEFKRCRYYFELQSETEIFYYLENGFYTEEHLINGKGVPQYFTFPWMNPSDINQTPSWVNNTIWYQIFPDRFCNGNESINPKHTKPWAGPKQKVKNEEIFGGDLRGIIQKLDYLQDLGITGLYLTPVNQAESVHKYDTTDYLQIDSAFGDKTVMKELVQKAHEKGIRIMVDGVFNHCGPQFPYWKDVVEKGPESEYFDWFMVKDWPFRKSGNNAKNKKYYSFAFIDAMPKLNTNNPKVIEYLLMICETWVKEYDIDGLRLDVANEISHKFCKELRKKMKGIKEDFYILGEIWHDSIPWLLGDEFDAVMNYPLAGTISDFWMETSQKKTEFEERINRCYTMYMQQNNDVLFNLLDSHDTIRLMSKVNNIDKVYQQLAVLFTMPGSACIYYGTEVVLEGGYDPDCRRCMPWKEIEEGKYNNRIAFIKQLISLRKEQTTFRTRNFHFTDQYEDDRMLEYIKIDDYGEKIEILLNCSEKEVELKKGGEVILSHLYADNKLQANGTLIRRYLE